MALYNKVDRRILKRLIEESKEPRITLSFYQYAHIADPHAFRDELYQAWDELGVLGRIYIAREGINAQISVPERNIDLFKEHLYAIPFLQGVRLNFAIEDDGKSFYKLKIKVRNKIVADGIDDPNFDPTDKGTHLNAAGFNALTDLSETLVVDMRNHYESEVGHFEKAILPDVDTFREALSTVAEMLQDAKDRPVVMYCTGGIRCEKASAYLKYKGFRNVYQLEGGIIEYARQVKDQGLKNKFHGKNFVFDERLGEHISEEIISHCHQCGSACDTHTNCANEACNLLFIQCEHCAATYEGCCSDACRDFVRIEPASRKTLRKGLSKVPRYFRKGRIQNFALLKDKS